MNTFKRKALSTAILAGLAAAQSFLTLGHAAPPGGEEPPPEPPIGDEPPDGDLETLDLDDDPPRQPPADDDGDADPAVLRQQAREARERAERAERERDEARRQAASHPAPPAPQSDAQRRWQEEEAKLADPNTSPQERWQIQADRTLRMNAETSQAALHEARELRDVTDFQGLVSSSPVAKKYEKRVEERLAEIRRNGSNLARRVILKMLIGDDIVEGRVKAKAKPKTDNEPATRVHRGQAPVTRSDVRGRGQQSEREKRRARLEGMKI